jgi:hypothetical protein
MSRLKDRYILGEGYPSEAPYCDTLAICRYPYGDEGTRLSICNKIPLRILYKKKVRLVIEVIDEKKG